MYVIAAPVYYHIYDSLVPDPGFRSRLQHRAHVYVWWLRVTSVLHGVSVLRTPSSRHLHVRIMHVGLAHTCIFVPTHVYNVRDTCKILFTELLSLT